MKTILHKAADRGYANHGWLQANHSFSFAGFYDPKKMHFGMLRVLNDDLIAPSMGFGTHPHDNMEIITIPLKGVLKHRDSSSNNEWQSVLPGEVQVMSAGTGVYHSEINGSSKEHLSLFQIWILPDKKNVEPRYDQKNFDPDQRKNKLQLLVTSFDDPDKDSLKVHQDAVLSRIDMDAGSTFEYQLRSSEHGVYMIVVSGQIAVAGQELDTRDALGIYDVESFKAAATTDAELLFIEIPMR
ncbi:MAG: pirin family protein [Flavobacteriaceae bacterium]|nr:pirin family protein [Flavobacteriaceae bacterium]MCB0475530.1 pirin family protein [Flavobacteriaceae bacterium]